MPRTTETSVKLLLGRNCSDDIPLSQFISTATILTDRLESCATENGYTLTSSELERIEAHLAAHFYGQADPFYKSKQTENASATFAGETGKGLESSLFGQTALLLDHTGCLKEITNPVKKKSAGLFWIGTDHVRY